MEILPICFCALHANGNFRLVILFRGADDGAVSFQIVAVALVWKVKRDTEVTMSRSMVNVMKTNYGQINCGVTAKGRIQSRVGGGGGGEKGTPYNGLYGEDPPEGAS